MLRPRLAFPVRPLAGPLLLRGVCFAAGVHLLSLPMGAAAGNALVPTPLAALVVVAVSGFLGLLEARRRNEVVLLANLGVGPGSLVLFAALPALALEVIVGVAGRL